MQLGEPFGLLAARSVTSCERIIPLRHFTASRQLVSSGQLVVSHKNCQSPSRLCLTRSMG